MPPKHEGSPRILVMDGNERNAALLSDFLESEGLEPVVVTDLERADAVFERESDFAVALVDIDRFETTVWPYCDRLRELGIPFIVLSGIQTPSVRRESREFGARSFVDKPIPKQDLRELIRSAKTT